MSGALKVVVISGSAQRPSRTLALLEYALKKLADEIRIDAQIISLAEIGPLFSGVLEARHLPSVVQDSIAAIESADFLLVGSPVYRGSYTGLFKHLIDFVDHNALVDTPVLLAATGGSERHSLVIDHQLRPLFSFFQARTLPVGIYATERDFDASAICSHALKERIALAISTALKQLSASPRLSAEPA